MKKTSKKLSFTSQSLRALTVSSLKVPRGGLPGDTYTEDSCNHCTDTNYCEYCEPSFAATYRGCIG